MKYLLSDGQFRVIQGDQKVSRKCYMEILKLKRVKSLGVNPKSMVQRIKPPEVVLKDGEAPPQKDEKIGEGILKRKLQKYPFFLSLFVFIYCYFGFHTSFLSLSFVRTSCLHGEALFPFLLVWGQEVLIRLLVL